MSSPDFIEDRELLFLATTTGIKFLGLTYDAVTVENVGLALRIVSEAGELVYFEVAGEPQQFVEALRTELQAALYGHILGYHAKQEAW